MKRVLITKGAAMQKTMIRAEESGQLSDVEFNDIECELSCSAREAGVGFAPFTNLDFMRVAMEYAQIRAKKVKKLTKVNPTR